MEQPKPFLIGAVTNGVLALVGLCVTGFIGVTATMFSTQMTLELVAVVGGSVLVLILSPVAGLVIALRGPWQRVSLATAALSVAGLFAAFVLMGGISLGSMSPFSTDPVPFDAIPVAAPEPDAGW